MSVNQVIGNILRTIKNWMILSLQLVRVRDYSHSSQQINIGPGDLLVACEALLFTAKFWSLPAIFMFWRLLCAISFF